LPARQFERLGDAHDFAHAFEQFEVAVIEVAMDADRAQHRVRGTGRAVDVEPVRNQFVDNVLNLGVRGALLHHDDHVRCVLTFRFSVLDFQSSARMKRTIKVAGHGFPVKSRNEP